MPYGNISYTEHVRLRSSERGISLVALVRAIPAGEVIKEYPLDRPRPSYLLLCWIEGEPIHAVAADDDESEETVLITAYRPDPDHWDQTFRRRRE